MGSNPNSRRNLIPGRLLWLGALVLTLLFSTLTPACADKKAKSVLEQTETPVTPIPPRITKDRKDLFYRFRDPKTGKFQTVNTFEDIPEALRHEVVVYDPTNDVAGWFFVANFKEPGPEGVFPCVARPASEMGSKTRVASGTARAYAESKSKTIRFYTASWCGVCRKARNFLKKEKLPYVEKDIEKDPSAKGELARAAKIAGVPASKLNGVPIFVIGKEMLTGFDANRVRQLARGN